MNKDKMWYMAHPYSVFANKESGTENRKELERQFNLANKAAGWLMDQGFVVISPISHCHPIAEAHELPRDWKFWKRIDETYIKACEGMIVVCNDGWDRSEGVLAEIELAKEMGKEIKYLIPIEDDFMISRWPGVYNHGHIRIQTPLFISDPDVDEVEQLHNIFVNSLKAEGLLREFKWADEDIDTSDWIDLMDVSGAYLSTFLPSLSQKRPYNPNLPRRNKW